MHFPSYIPRIFPIFLHIFLHMQNCLQSFFSLNKIKLLFCSLWKGTPMKNNQIGIMLRKYRKMNALSVNDVVVELQDKYGVQVAEKTVYGWESNQAHPTSDVFVALCDIYKINNISDVFNSKEPKGFPITAEERQLIENYRQYPEMQAVVRKILNMNE